MEELISSGILKEDDIGEIFKGSGKWLNFEIAEGIYDNHLKIKDKIELQEDPRIAMLSVMIKSIDPPFDKMEWKKYSPTLILKLCSCCENELFGGIEVTDFFGEWKKKLKK
jgi:hypothetical protein